MKHSDEELLIILKAKLLINKRMKWRRQEYRSTVYNWAYGFPRELVDEAITALVVDGILTDTERSKHGKVFLTYVPKEAA